MFVVDSIIKSVAIGRISAFIAAGLGLVLQFKGYDLVQEDTKYIVDILKALSLAWAGGASLTSKVRERKRMKNG